MNELNNYKEINCEKFKRLHLSSQKVLDRLKEDIDLMASNSPDVKKYRREFRQSTIHIFELSVNTLYKFLKDYLIRIEALELNVFTLNSVFKECYTAKLISQNDLELIITLISDKNRTSECYVESISKEICAKIPDHYILMKKILDRIDNKKFN